MSTVQKLLSCVIESAKKGGLDQNDLARAAGLAPETISRAKKRATADMATMIRLAEAAGLEITLQPIHPTQEAQPVRSSLADPKWGLAWSNRNASAESLVSSALLRGAFSAVLEAALEYGVDYVRQLWKKLCADRELAPKPRMRKYVENMIENIDRGLTHVEA